MSAAFARGVFLIQCSSASRQPGWSCSRCFTHEETPSSGRRAHNKQLERTGQFPRFSGHPELTVQECRNAIIDGPTIDLLQENGASEGLVSMLKSAVGAGDGVD